MVESVGLVENLSYGRRGDEQEVRRMPANRGEIDERYSEASDTDLHDVPHDQRCECGHRAADPAATNF